MDSEIYNSMFDTVEDDEHMSRSQARNFELEMANLDAALGITPGHAYMSQPPQSLHPAHLAGDSTLGVAESSVLEMATLEEETTKPEAKPRKVRRTTENNTFATGGLSFLSSKVCASPVRYSFRCTLIAALLQPIVSQMTKVVTYYLRDA